MAGNSVVSCSGGIVFSGYDPRRLCAMIDVIAIRARPVEPFAGVAMLTRIAAAAVVFCPSSAASAQTAVSAPVPDAEPLRLVAACHRSACRAR